MKGIEKFSLHNCSVFRILLKQLSRWFQGLLKCYFQKSSVPDFGQSDLNVLVLMLKSNKFQEEEPWDIFQNTFSIKSYSYLFINFRKLFEQFL